VAKKRTENKRVCKKKKNARRRGKNKERKKERKKNSYYRLVLLSFGLARSPNIIIAIIRERGRKNADAHRRFLPFLPTHSSMCMRRRAFRPMKYQQQEE